jgi:hypothetical protein
MRISRTILGVLLASTPVFAQTWTALSGTTFDVSKCPPDGAMGSVDYLGTPYPYRSGGSLGSAGCRGAVTAWTGGVARTKAGSEQLWLLDGGGHNDYGGNESYRLRLHGTPDFTKVGDPSVLIASYHTNSTRSYPDNKPSSRHTYDQTAYVPWLDKFFMFNGAAYGGNGTSYRDGWFYDPNVDPAVSNPWTEVTPSSAGGCVNPRTGGYSGSPYGNVIVNPADQMIYMWYGAGWMFKLNPATSCYTVVGQVWPRGTPPYDVHDGWKAIMDTSRNRIVTVGGGKVQTVSLTGTVVEVTASVGAACATWINSYGPGAFYDATADLYVGMVQTVGNTIYKLNPTTWACTTQTTTGGPTGNPIRGMWGRLSYFPTLGKIAVLADFNQQWYTLDYGVAVPSTSNTITIKNEGTTATNHPVQIGRAFVQGEIPNGSLPQAYIDGVGYVSTQVDVKTRWSDAAQSLKHGIISFLIPTFTAGQTYTVRFPTGSTVGSTPIDGTAAPYNFDAVISLTNGGTTRTASARAMLTAGDFTYWTSGPIATTVLLGHHAQGFACPAGVATGAGAVASKYDFGMNSRCAFRPLFEATFWAGIDKVKVRYIGEIANTEQYEDVVTTSMSLTIGNTGPTTVYTRASLTFNAGSRWTRTAWIGGAPPAASINHNLAYLASTKALPNFDTSKTVSGATITSVYSAWTAAPKEIGQHGMWDNPYGGGGGHDHVGPYPSWVVQALYSGDYRLWEVALGQADIHAQMEWHLREGKAGKKLDRAGLVDGVGHPMSVSTRPSFSWLNFSEGDNSWASGADKVTPVGTTTNTGANWDGEKWNNIVSHQAESNFPLCLVTGDHFYCTEGKFQAAWNASYYHSYNWRGRGPTGAYGGIPDRRQQILQTRGQGWVFRNRVEMAWVTPDADPFKAYLELLTADAIAYWEGQRGITGTAYQGNALWNYGASTTTYAPDATDRQWYPAGTSPSPLHFWDLGSLAVCYTSTNNPNGLPVNDTSVVSMCNSPWMENYVLYGLGRGAELGYASTALRNWLGVQPIGALTDASYNPYLAGAYRTNIVAANNSYFPTWAASKTGYISQVQTETGFEPGAAGTSGGENSNVHTLIGAVSMVADQAGGGTAWSWVAANILPSSSLKWAILPRSLSAPAGQSWRINGRISGTVR